MGFFRAKQRAEREARTFDALFNTDTAEFIPLGKLIYMQILTIFKSSFADRAADLSESLAE